MEDENVLDTYISNMIEGWLDYYSGSGVSTEKEEN